MAACMMFSISKRIEALAKDKKKQELQYDLLMPISETRDMQKLMILNFSVQDQDVDVTFFHNKLGSDVCPTLQ